MTPHQNMRDAFDINQPEVSRSLAETVEWCTHRQLTATPLSDQETKRRLDVMDEAAELMYQAMNESQNRINRWLRRDYSKSPKYKQGLHLMSEAGIGSVASFAQRLRTPELRSSINYEKAPDEISRRRAVESVVSRRSAMVARLPLRQRKPLHLQGKLLCYWPEENLACGAAEVQSLGFFDVDNTPPWDTWVAYSDRVLLSWVPGDLLELAERGIHVNPEGCITWYTQP